MNEYFVTCHPFIDKNHLKAITYSMKNKYSVIMITKHVKNAYLINKEDIVMHISFPDTFLHNNVFTFSTEPYLNGHYNDDFDKGFYRLKHIGLRSLLLLLK